jgi:hypothetical protein
LAAIELVASGFDVAPLRAVLKDASLWDWNRARTQSPESPHFGCSDIWARYAPPSEYGINGPHTSVWYEMFGPYLLYPLKMLALDIMDMTGGKELGGVLVTRIPPHGVVKPHKDSGWHAEYYNAKFGLSIEANEHQAFCFDDCHLVTKPGDLFLFDNSKVHWVLNNSNHDRITAIFCTRR